MSARTGISRASLCFISVFSVGSLTAVLMASAVSAVPEQVHAYEKHCNQNPEPICQYPIHFKISLFVNFQTRFFFPPVWSPFVAICPRFSLLPLLRLADAYVARP